MFWSKFCLNYSPRVGETDIEETERRDVSVIRCIGPERTYVIVLHAKTTTQPYPPSGISSITSGSSAERLSTRDGVTVKWGVSVEEILESSRGLCAKVALICSWTNRSGRRQQEFHGHDYWWFWNSGPVGNLGSCSTGNFAFAILWLTSKWERRI